MKPLLLVGLGIFAMLGVASVARASSSGGAGSRWLHLHPGGGGQIQGISADPNIPGRLYTCSDVEGMYRSDDWGNTWRSIGRGIIHHMVFYVAIDPRASDTLYAGTLYGLSKSVDGGATWSTLVGGYASAAFDFDPFNADRFIAARSWYIKDSQLTSQTSQPDQSTTGERFVLLSEDAGRSFQKVVYEKAQGYAQCYSVTHDPTRRGHVYLGAFAGLYHSQDGGKSFSRVAGPAGFEEAGCSGAAITPDGRFLLATFAATEGNRFRASTRIYAAPIDEAGTTGAWQDINDGLFFPSTGANQYWNPKVDPRSLRADYGLAGTYKILLGFLNGPVGQLAGQQGLHEGTFNVDAIGRLKGSFQRIFGRPGVSKEFTFDLGWNEIGPQNRQNAYWPLTWDDASLPAHLSALGSSRARKVYVTNNQQLYVGNADQPFDRWVVLSNKYVRSLNGHRFYQTRGFASTVNYDMDAWGGYYIQGMADNGFMESYDGGESWSQSSGVGSPSAMANGDAVLVLAPRNEREPPLALVGTAPGFGGGAHGATGVLRAKSLVDLSGKTAGPSDWKPIAGGPQGAGGLQGGPNGGPRIWYLAAHPANNNCVFAGTHAGLFFTNDIRALASGQGGSFTKVEGLDGSFSFGRIYVDPRSAPDRPILYVKCVAQPTQAVSEPDIATGADSPPGAPADATDRGRRGSRRDATTSTARSSQGGEFSPRSEAGRDRLVQLVSDGTGFVQTLIETPTALGNGDDFAYWRDLRGAREFMAYSDRSASVFVREREDGKAAWSEWSRVLTENDVISIYPAPWWNWAGFTPGGHVSTQMSLTLNGLVGYENSLTVGSYAAFGKHGYAMLRAVRVAEGNWKWSDWTGDESDAQNFMTVPRVWRAKLMQPRPGETYYAAASRGGGLIVRRLPFDDEPATP